MMIGFGETKRNLLLSNRIRDSLHGNSMGENKLKPENADLVSGHNM